MPPFLIALAVQHGLPILKSILTQRLGDAGGRLAAEALERIVTRAGVADAEALETLAGTTPGRVVEAMREVERAAPDELVAVYLRETEGRLALLQAEQQDGGWRSGWRPAGMYLIGFLWLWNVVALHVANAIWKTALPPMPFDTLIQISGLYMGLYMGGHTVKDLAAKWSGKA